MNTKDLIELDLDRLHRLELGEVTITNQTDVQITYQIRLSDSHNPSKVIETTGKIQTLFGPRLLSSGAFVGEAGENCVTARVCLQYSKLTKNQPAMASVKSFLTRASGAAVEPTVKIDGGRILYDGKEVGEMFYSKPVKMSKTTWLGEGSKASLKKLLSVADELKIPDSFYYIWVDKIKLSKIYRGAGLGSATFRALFAKVKNRPLVVSLNPGEITSGASQINLGALKKFYASVGFTVLVLDGEQYAVCFKG